MTIKAIDTHYNGYKFRSRLEARWAVFFDELGIKYEYEKEGYDLGDGWHYLPDFYLPDSNQFIEIKSLDKYSPIKRWYFAGKFTGAKNIQKLNTLDWREEILKINTSKYSLDTGRLYCLINGDFYVGPFYKDPVYEMFAHGKDGGHILVDSGDVCYDDGVPFNESSVSDSFVYSETLNTSFKQIKECDIFFAYLFSNDCYGTLAEIGYAKALGKTIYICVANNVKKDLWFSILCADEIFTGNIEQVLCDLFWSKKYGNNEELLKLAILANSKDTTGILCYGDPLDDKQIITYGNHAKSHSYINPKKGGLLRIEQQAAKKARSARFEHGENP